MKPHTRARHLRRLLRRVPRLALLVFCPECAVLFQVDDDEPTAECPACLFRVRVG